MENLIFCAVGFASILKCFAIFFQIKVSVTDEGLCSVYVSDIYPQSAEIQLNLYTEHTLQLIIKYFEANSRRRVK